MHRYDLYNLYHKAVAEKIQLPKKLGDSSRPQPRFPASIVISFPRSLVRLHVSLPCSRIPSFPSFHPTIMPDEETPRETPEESRTDDPSLSKAGANNLTKDRKCQYCNQPFTSSSLGRHLDQFLFKKKPDGVHDVEEIRRIRSGITRRQARTASGKRDGSPDSAHKKGSSDPYAGDADGKGRGAPPRMMFNTPTWHATGVINDIPNPSRVPEAPRIAPTQTRSGSIQLPDYASRGANANSPDTLRALELALREVLDNVKAATYVTPPPHLRRNMPQLTLSSMQLSIQTSLKSIRLRSLAANFPVSLSAASSCPREPFRDTTFFYPGYVSSPAANRGSTPANSECDSHQGPAMETGATCRRPKGTCQTHGYGS